MDRQLTVEISPVAWLNPCKFRGRPSAANDLDCPVRLRNYVLLILVAMLWASIRPSGHDRAPNGLPFTLSHSLSICKDGLAAIGAKINPLPYVRARFARPEPLTADQYRALAQKTVGEYFPNGVTPENTQAFLDDLATLADNFERIHLRKGQLRHGPETRDKIIESVGFMLRQGTPDSISEKTLQELFLAEHLANSEEDLKKKPPVWDRYKRSFARAPVALGTVLLAVVWGQMQWNMKNIMYETTDFVNTPIRTNISRYTNDNLGWIGVKMQMGLTQIQQALDVRNKMIAATDQMDQAAAKMQAAKKFQVDGVSLEEAKKMWLDAEQAFLEYRKELNSVLPDNVAMGRSYWNQAIVANPLTFVTALNTAKEQITTHEDRISNLSHRLAKDGSLSSEDARLLANSRVELEIAKRQMGTMLSLLKVYQTFYPEHSRPSWSGDPTQTNPYMTKYNAIMEGLGIEYYSAQYVAELREQMNALGQQLSGVDPTALAKRKEAIEKELSTMIVEQTASASSPVTGAQ